MNSDPLVKKLDHINFTVDSFSESAQWYGALLGFEIVEEAHTDGVHWGVLRSGDCMLCIYEHPDFSHRDRFELIENKHHGMAHFAFRITDTDRWLQQAKEMNIKILYDGLIRWPHSQSWYIKDPTGYEIEIVAWDGDQITFD